MRDVQRYLWQIHCEKGWDKCERSCVEHVALIHSELSEALEELRKGHDPDHVYFGKDGKPEGFPIELADAAIRIMNVLTEIGLDLEDMVRVKSEYNKTREALHGKRM